MESITSRLDSSERQISSLYLWLRKEKPLNWTIFVPWNCCQCWPFLYLRLILRWMNLGKHLYVVWWYVCSMTDGHKTYYASWRTVLHNAPCGTRALRKMVRMKTWLIIAVNTHILSMRSYEFKPETWRKYRPLLKLRWSIINSYLSPQFKYMIFYLLF